MALRSSGFLLAAGIAMGTGLVACGQAGKGAPPTGPAAAAAAPASWHGFGVDRWPPANWRPYAASSPFNQRIAPGTRPLAASDAMIAQALRWGPPGHLTAGVAQSPDDWGHPTYYATTSDPIFTLRTTAPYGPNPLDGKRIRIPDAAQAAGGGDAHMAIVTPDGWEYDLWQVQDKPAGGGTLRFSWGGRLRIDGNGLRTGGTASRFGNLAGMIRAPELAAGRINHALFVVLRCAGDGSGYGPGTRRRARDESAYVRPAVSGGAVCPPGTVAPPMGARLRLAMSDAQIRALGLPTWKAAILRALARYGGYVGDTGGDGIGFMFESSTMYTSFGRPDPLVAIATAAQLPDYGGRYAFDVGSGVDWARYLQVIGPPPRRR
jgi:hypothetical protein